MRVFNESRYIRIIQWVPLLWNIADILTKLNLSTYKNLNAFMVEEILHNDILKDTKRVTLKSKV